MFGKPIRLLTCECERSEDTTLNQAFQLITGELLNDMLAEPDNRIGRLLASGKPMAAVVEELYLAALSRPPSPTEKEAALRDDCEGEGSAGGAGGSGVGVGECEGVSVAEVRCDF